MNPCLMLMVGLYTYDEKLCYKKTEGGDSAKSCRERTRRNFVMEGIDIIGWLIWIAIGLVAGYIADRIMGVDNTLVMNLIVGVVGAVLGGWLASMLGITVGWGLLGTLIIAIIGAVILLFILRLVRSG